MPSGNVVQIISVKVALVAVPSPRERADRRERALVVKGMPDFRSDGDKFNHQFRLMPSVTASHDFALAHNPIRPPTTPEPFPCVAGPRIHQQSLSLGSD